MKLLSFSDRLASFGMTGAVCAVVMPTLLALGTGSGPVATSSSALKTFNLTLPQPRSEPPPPASPTRPMPPPGGKPPAGFHIPKVSRISTADPNPQRAQPVRPEPGLPPVPNIPPAAIPNIPCTSCHEPPTAS